MTSVRKMEACSRFVWELYEMFTYALNCIGLLPILTDYSVHVLSLLRLVLAGLENVSWIFYCHLGVFSPLYNIFHQCVCVVRWERSQGCIVRNKNQGMSPETVRDQWDNICDFTNATKPANINGNQVEQPLDWTPMLPYFTSARYGTDIIHWLIHRCIEFKLL